MPISDYMREIRSHIGTRMLEMPSAAVAVRDAEGRLLLVHSAETGFWILPGGGVEPLEVPSEAALREVWEETGVRAEITGLLGVYGGPEYRVTYTNGDRTSFVMVVFDGRPLGGTARPDGVETLDVAWVTHAEAHALPLAAWMREPVDDIFGRARPCYRPSGWSAPAS